MIETISPNVLDDSADSSRFLAQATFGADRATIDALAGQDYAAWITDQKTKPISYTKPYMEQIWQEQLAHPAPDQSQFAFRYVDNSTLQPFAYNFTTPWMRNVVFGEDMLRQRVTWCLSQILVISYKGNLRSAGLTIADYYDLLTDHAFGNYRDLLMAVSTHPGMAYYLSSLGNQKADPSVNRYPDENYAREVMQLFTIGLWELNPDGSYQLDAEGEPIPTYDNEDIAELARVFTGLWFYDRRFGKNDGYTLAGNLATQPLVMFADEHDDDEKTLFHDKSWETTVSAGQGGLVDIEQVIDLLFNHPNTAPFICKQLIQFLVKSDPSGDFIGRISAIFADNGNGVRGDLHAVVKAILLDTEARTYDPTDVRTGKLVEPMVRITRLVKALHAGVNSPDFVYWWWTDKAAGLGQWPMASPSVFNFFEPNYIHRQSPLGQASPPVNSPEFMIVTPVTIPDLANYLYVSVTRRVHELWGYDFAEPGDFALDFSELMPIADDTTALIDYLDLLFCYGQLQPQTRAIIEQAVNRVNPVDDAKKLIRIHSAVYMITISPDAAILR